MLYAIEAMEPTVFNWEEALLSVFKDQLTKCQQGDLNQFGNGSILACLFFEWVPHLRPQVVFIDLRARDPHMLRWVEIMARMGAGKNKVKFVAPFFCWLNNQILMIEDYAYIGIELKYDPDLPLPRRE